MLRLKLTIIVHDRTAVSVMNANNPLQCSTYYFLKTNFHIIPLSATGFSQMCPPCVFCDNIFNAFLKFPTKSTYRLITATLIMFVE
jgi:hypothetical protein